MHWNLLQCWEARCEISHINAVHCSVVYLRCISTQLTMCNIRDKGPCMHPSGPQRVVLQRGRTIVMEVSFHARRWCFYSKLGTSKANFLVASCGHGWAPARFLVKSLEGQASVGEFLSFSQDRSLVLVTWDFTISHPQNDQKK